ncbi:MAG: hypothetical protein ACLR13_00530 [Acutalibacteraceae bacterium]
MKNVHSEIIEHTVSVHTDTDRGQKDGRKAIKTPPRMKKPDGVYIARASRNVRKLDFNAGGTANFRTCHLPALSTTLHMIHDDYNCLLK